MNIELLSDEGRPAWDDYVRAHPGGLPQHLSAWRDVLSASYGHPTHFLCATDRGRVRGVLPLFFIDSLLLGKKATTMPGGLCADDADTAAALVRAGQEAAQRHGARSLLIHDSRARWPVPTLRTSSQHHARIIPLPGNEEALWEQLQSNVRRQIRIARRHGLRAQIDRRGDHLDRFYDRLSRFTHAVGTPAFSQSFLSHVIRAFPGQVSIVTIWQGERDIAGYFQLELGTTIYGMWGAAERDTLDLRPVYLAYWEIMRDAVARHFRALDMGRSPNNSGAAQNKAQWGGEEVPIFQQVVPLRATASSAAITDQVQNNPAMRWLRALWPRLPFPVAQFLGPRLRHHVPFA